MSLRRKLTLRAHGEQVVLVKNKHERIEHVWMKAFLWALYLPQYPGLLVEVGIGDKYRPDVVQMDMRLGRPVFWGEAGQVGPDKIQSLVRRYPDTRFAMAKWDTRLAPFVEMVEEAVADVERGAPFDLIRIPEDAGSRFIADGRIEIDFPDVTWTRIGNLTTWKGTD
ncbi:hypothetical protein [Longibacter sp.]|uniref:hypothetical protein n=1 Tax=Longibacter sp. TaxID=2045415 RepID=UPI003EB70151